MLSIATESALDSTPRELRPSLSAVTAPPATAGIIGESEALRSLLRHVRAVAATDATALLHGETGAGKERIARALHELSDRSRGPFVAVNCAAVPASLLESELLGHERGAFTGALTRRIGRFELAHDGTLFLDEIGELPLHLQPKLLRVLQEREFERLGGTRTFRTNARVVAASNRDLGQMVRQGEFREDLYYRLSVVPLRIPALRERAEDIPLLARHFVSLFAARLGRRVQPPSPRLLEALTRYPWPGNVRELQNVLERAVVLAENGELDIPELVADTSTAPAPSAPPASTQSLAAINKAHILRVLEQTNWVLAGPQGAAARLEVKRTTLQARMKKLGIRRGD